MPLNSKHYSQYCHISPYCTIKQVTLVLIQNSVQEHSGRVHGILILNVTYLAFPSSPSITYGMNEANLASFNILNINWKHRLWDILANILNVTNLNILNWMFSHIRAYYWKHKLWDILANILNIFYLSKHFKLNVFTFSHIRAY